MTLEDEVKQLMFCRDKIKEFKKEEKAITNKIIEYLKNHNQDGVIFKHNNKSVTLMVESTNIRKCVSLKEKQKKVEDILYNSGITDVDSTTKEIIEGIKSLTVTSEIPRDKLKVKMKK